MMQHSMTPGHKLWKKFTLTGDVLSAAWWPSLLFTWKNSISLGLNLFSLTLITPSRLIVTSAIPPFIYSVGPGNLFILLDPNVFFANSFAVGSFRYPLPSPCCLIFSRSISILFPHFFKMGWEQLCLDGKKIPSNTAQEVDEVPIT